MKIQSGLIILLVVVVLFTAGCKTPEEEVTMNALMIIQESFNADEYGIPRKALEESQVNVTVAGTSLESLKAYANADKVTPDYLLEDIRVDHYDLIVFVGGYPYQTDIPEMHRIAREAVAGGVKIGAICNGVITLAEADVLEGIKVAELTYHPADILEDAGAVLVADFVVRDGSFITACSSGVSLQFGTALVEAIFE